MRDVLLAHMAMLFNGVFFTGLAIFAKPVLKLNDPIIFGLYRDALATPLMLLYARIKGGPFRWPGTNQDGEADPNASNAGDTAYSQLLDTPATGEIFTSPATSLTSSGGKSNYGSIDQWEFDDLPNLGQSRECFKDWALFAVIGGVSMFGSQITFLWGDLLAGPTLATIYMALVPAVCAVLALLMREESLSWQRSAGVLFAVGGVMFVIAPWQSQSTGSDAKDYLSGNVVLMACAILTAMSPLLQKPLLRKGYKPSMITGVSYCFALLALLITSGVKLAIDRDFDVFRLKGGASSYFAMFYAAVICSAVNYNLCAFANKHLDATIIQSYSVLNPIIAMTYGHFVSGEVVKLHDGIGILLVLLGLPLVGRANQTKGSQEVPEGGRAPEPAPDPESDVESLLPLAQEVDEKKALLTEEYTVVQAKEEV